ncbi:MAG: HAD hydrolase-like protein, partial [Ruminococcus sp.]|nr:HAD hydrolase-like protein [Ruminococcus sp.]
DRERTVMLGDTWYDAKGARLCGVDFIGVRYGYGEISDMEEQGAKLFADTPGELFELLK